MTDVVEIDQEAFDAAVLKYDGYVPGVGYHMVDWSYPHEAAAFEAALAKRCPLGDDCGIDSPAELADVIKSLDGDNIDAETAAHVKFHASVALGEPVGKGGSFGANIESSIHRLVTNMGDDAYGDGRLTREERIALSSAVGDALDTFVNTLEKKIPGIYERGCWAPSAADIPYVQKSDDEVVQKIRRVRTPEGAKRFGQPIGSVIIKDPITGKLKALEPGSDAEAVVLHNDRVDRGAAFRSKPGNDPRSLREAAAERAKAHRDELKRQAEGAGGTSSDKRRAMREQRRKAAIRARRDARRKALGAKPKTQFSGGDNMKRYQKRDDEQDFTIDVPIAKVDEDKRQCFGWAQIATNADGSVLIDKQGDFIDDISELEKAAYTYVDEYRDGGDMHVRKGVARMIESMVFTKEKIAKLGIPEGTLPEGWWIGFQVDDDQAWSDVKNGRRKMFSVGGRGRRTPVEG